MRPERSEETGYIPQKIVFLGKVLECAYSTKEREIFIATGCEKIMDQQLDPYEYIEVVLKPISTFIEQLMKGLSTDPEVAWMALYHLGIIKTSNDQ